MKSGLKRIEATLHELTRDGTTSYPKLTAAQKRSHIYSFEIKSAVQKRHSPTQQHSNDAQQTTLLPQNASREPKLPQFNLSQTASKSPAHCFSSLNSHYKGSISQPVKVKDTSPSQGGASGFGLKTDVATDKAQLREVVRQVEDLYLEGPIVDGWLESYPGTSEPRIVTLSNESTNVYRFEKGIACEPLRPNYRLCGLNASGQKWSHPCPLEQLPSVSMAIGRYQRLLQLLEYKQYLETRLASSY